MRLQWAWGIIFGLMAAVLFYAPSVDAAEPHYEIVINIPAFSLHLYADGVLHKTYPIGVGTTVNPSQLGTTQIINNVKFPSYYPPDWYRRGLRPIPPGPDNPVGTRWLGLGIPGYGIHGTNDPASIGTAASAGCIRMYNEDVEELASLVKVGTSVTFVYETVQPSRDVLTGHPYVRIHKDIYNQGTNSLTRAYQALEQNGINLAQVDAGTLEALLQEASGQPRPVPMALPLFFNDQRVPFHAVNYGGRVLLPISKVAELTNVTTETIFGDDGMELKVAGRRVDRVTWLGQVPFMSVDEASKALGVLMSMGTDGEVYLQQVRLVTRHGQVLAIRPFVMNGWLLLPVHDVLRLTQVSARWDASLGALRVQNQVLFGVEMIDGIPHIAHDRLAKHLGVEIQWQSGTAVATVIN